MIVELKSLQQATQRDSFPVHSIYLADPPRQRACLAALPLEVSIIQ